MFDRVIIATLSFGLGWSFSNLSKELPTLPQIQKIDFPLQKNRLTTTYQAKDINKTSPILKDSISLLLENNNFYDALSIYLDSPNPSKHLYKIESYLKRLTQTNIIKASKEIEIFRENEPANTLFNLLIDNYIKTNKFKKAIDTINTQRDDYIDEESDNILLERLKDVVLAYEKYLYQRKSFKELILLFKNMLNYDKNDYYLKQLSKYKSLNAFDYIIPLKKYNDHFIVEVFLDQQSFNLLIDTGASYIFIDSDKSYFFDLLRDDLILNTANGKMEASLYKVETLNIGNLEIKDINITSADFTQEGIDGLLGMNFFKLFDFNIDQKNAILYLKRR